MFEIVHKAIERNFRLLDIFLPQPQARTLCLGIHARNMVLFFESLFVDFFNGFFLQQLLWPIVSGTILNICIAFQLVLPAYVLLEVIDWLPGVHAAVSHVKKIHFIERTHKSIAKCAAFRHLLLEE